MNKTFLMKIFCIILLSCLILIGCDLGNNQENNFNNDWDDSIASENADKGNELIASNLNEQLKELKGSIWVSGRYIIKFPNNHLNLVIFQYDQFISSSTPNLNGIVTHGNFRLSFYDESVVSFLTYHDEPRIISFSAELSAEKLIVSGLTDFHYTSPTPTYPAQRIAQLKSWNRTYTREEE